MTTILVTNATDPIGAYIAARLADDPTITVRAFDFEGPEALQTTFAGIDKVLLVVPTDHLARAQLVIDAARAEGVGHLVHVSIHPAIDARVRSSGIPYTLLRHYQPVEPQDVADLAALVFAGDVHFGRTYVLRGRLSARTGCSTRDELRAPAKHLDGNCRCDRATYELLGSPATNMMHAPR